MRDLRPSSRDSEASRLRALAAVAERRASARPYWTGLISILDGTCRLFGIRGRLQPQGVPDQRRHLALGVQRKLRQRMRAQDARTPGTE